MWQWGDKSTPGEVTLSTIEEPRGIISVPLKRRTGAAILPMWVIRDLSATHGTGFLSVEPQGDAVFTEYMLQQQGKRHIMFLDMNFGPLDPGILIKNSPGNFRFCLIDEGEVPALAGNICMLWASISFYLCLFFFFFSP